MKTRRRIITKSPADIPGPSQYGESPKCLNYQFSWLANCGVLCIDMIRNQQWFLGVYSIALIGPKQFQLQYHCTTGFLDRKAERYFITFYILKSLLPHEFIIIPHTISKGSSASVSGKQNIQIQNGFKEIRIRRDAYYRIIHRLVSNWYSRYFYALFEVWHDSGRRNSHQQYRAVKLAMVTSGQYHDTIGNSIAWRYYWLIWRFHYCIRWREAWLLYSLVTVIWRDVARLSSAFIDKIPE